MNDGPCVFYTFNIRGGLVSSQKHVWLKIGVLVLVILPNLKTNPLCWHTQSSNSFSHLHKLFKKKNYRKLFDHFTNTGNHAFGVLFFATKSWRFKILSLVSNHYSYPLILISSCNHITILVWDFFYLMGLVIKLVVPFNGQQQNTT